MLGIVRPSARICSIYHVSICISCVQVTASNNAIIPEPREMGLKIFPAWKMFIEWRSAGQRGARGAASESNANISWGCRAQLTWPDTSHYQLPSCSQPPHSPPLSTYNIQLPVDHQLQRDSDGRGQRSCKCNYVHFTKMPSPHADTGRKSQYLYECTDVHT